MTSVLEHFASTTLLTLIAASLPTLPVAANESSPAAELLPPGATVQRPGQPFRQDGKVQRALPQGFLQSLEGELDPTKDGSEVAFGQSMTDESLAQLQQAVIPLQGGGFAVVWVERYPTDSDVRMQWLGPDGDKLFEAEGRLLAGTDAHEHNAVAAPHPAGGAFAALVRAADSFGSVVVQSFDADGNPRWPGDGALVSTANDFPIDPHLVPDPDGGVYVCFERFVADGIWCQHIDRDGNSMWAAEGLLAGGAPGWRVVPRGVLDGSGGLLIFWRNQGNVFDQVPEAMRMEGQRFASDGTRLWGETGRLLKTTDLAESNGHGFRFFDVISDDRGGAILAYNDWVERAAPNLDVVAQRVAEDGSLPWGDGVAVIATTDHYQHSTTIAAPDGGAFVVASGDRDLRLFRLGPDGSHRWPATGLELSDPAATALNYSAFGSFDQDLLRLVWTHQRRPQTFDIDVQFARYTLAGERLEGPAGLAVTTVRDAQFVNGFAFSPHTRTALAVWDDRRKGTWEDLDVYGALVPDQPVGGEPTIDLQGGRFRVEGTWTDFEDNTGVMKLWRLSDSGAYATFFADSNAELFLKILDGCGFNGKYWIFSTQLTNVEYQLQITDTQTGQLVRIENPLGFIGPSVLDADSIFDQCGDGGGGGGPLQETIRTTDLPPPTPPEIREFTDPSVVGTTCTPGETTMCLRGGRFRVTAGWLDFEGGDGVARPRPLSSESGTAWFFDPDNPELFLKILDGCPFNGKSWLFVGGLSNVGIDLRVEDLASPDGKVLELSTYVGQEFPASLLTETLFSDCEL